MALLKQLFLLTLVASASLAFVLPANTDYGSNSLAFEHFRYRRASEPTPLPSSSASPATQEHHVVGIARPLVPVVPVAVVSTNYGYGYQQPPPPQPTPQSQLFTPTNTGANLPRPSSSGLSYVNNLLGSKVYGGSTGGGIAGTGGFPLGTSGLPSGGLPTGSVIPTGQQSVPFVPSNLGGTGTSGFPSSIQGPSPNDLFGPGLTPLALDLGDGSSPTGTGPTATTNGNPAGNTPLNVPSTNGPNSPSPNVPPTGINLQQSQEPIFQDPFPVFDTQSDQWVWPDEIQTGALPVIQLGHSALRGNRNNNPASRGTAGNAGRGVQGAGVTGRGNAPTGGSGLPLGVIPQSTGGVQSVPFTLGREGQSATQDLQQAAPVLDVGLTSTPTPFLL